MSAIMTMLTLPSAGRSNDSANCYSLVDHVTLVRSPAAADERIPFRAVLLPDTTMANAIKRCTGASVGPGTRAAERVLP
jgi:hypothetical protein